jgi:hypothetical protein
MGENGWIAVMFGGLFFMGAVMHASENYRQAIVETTAMEKGYEQVIEEGKVLWKRKSGPQY